MLTIFLTTLQQTSILLIFILCGYFFRKKGLITDEGRKTLAKLLVNFFAPAYSIISLSTVVTVQEIQKYLTMLLVGVVGALVSVFLAFPFAKALAKNDKYRKNVFIYTFALGNIGYFGYPLIDGVFGAVAKAQMMLLSVPFCVAIYSFGYHVLTQFPDEANAPKKEEKKPFIKRISFMYCPPMAGMYLGVALGLLSSGLGFAIPTYVTKLVTPAGNCQSVPAMLITGAALANVPLPKLFTSWKAYVIGLIRLLVYPAIIGAICAIVYLCGWQSELFRRVAFLSIIVVAMPVGMNTVVYPESVGIDSTEGAKNCFISYIMALATLPLVFSVAQLLLNVAF